MSTISILETSTDGQAETAILLEEYEKRIATLQESLKQAGRIHPNEAVILQEIKMVVEERDDMKRRLENAELLLERLKEDNEQFKFDLDLYNNADAKALALWRENHPDASKCFVPSLGKMLVWLMDRVERAEAVKESLTSALWKIEKIAEDWNLYDFKQIRDIAKTALRTAEESSVVGLIDSTPAKQQEDSANAG